MLTKKILILFLAIFLILGALYFNKLKIGASFFYSILFNKSIELKKEGDGSINVLLLGIGGGTHDGPNLTDTIIFANVNPSKNTINLISIPRDLWVGDLGTGGKKINSAYSDGQDSGKNGILLSKATVHKVLGQQVDYVIVLDFNGFVKLVDYLGGVDVVVKNTLDDSHYPIEGKESDPCGHADDEIKQFVSSVSAEVELWDFFSCRYKKLHVDTGVVRMDGVTALEFVRSRHADGQEGSDFARSQRQQSVIQAVKNKVFSLGIILNPVKIIGIYNILHSNINTDIKVDEFDDFVKLAGKVKGAKISSNVIDIGDEENKRAGLLTHPEISEKQNFEWVLVPRKGDGNFSEIKEYVSCVLKNVACKVTDQGIQIGELKKSNN